MKLKNRWFNLFFCVSLGIVSALLTAHLTPYLKGLTNVRGQMSNLPQGPSNGETDLENLRNMVLDKNIDELLFKKKAGEMLRKTPRQVMDLLFHEVDEEQSKNLTTLLVEDLLKLPEDRLLESLKGVRTKQEMRDILNSLYKY